MSPPGFDRALFIRKYIFPGGYVPALSEVFASTERTRLWVADCEVLRLHYYWTIKAWRERFGAQRAAVVAQDGRALRPDVGILPRRRRARVPERLEHGLPAPRRPHPRRGAGAARTTWSRRSAGSRPRRGRLESERALDPPPPTTCRETTPMRRCSDSAVRAAVRGRTQGHTIARPQEDRSCCRCSRRSGRFCSGIVLIMLGNGSISPQVRAAGSRNFTAADLAIVTSGYFVGFLLRTARAYTPGADSGGWGTCVFRGAWAASCRRG